MGNASTKDYSKSISVGTSSRKAHWDYPGLPAPPGKPILISGTNEAQPDIVAIRWDRSPSNGGSAIVGYLVEHRRLGSSHWVRSASGLCAFPELTLSGLEPGWRYQFRVRAQNAVGLSRPSEVSEPLTVTLQKAVAACAPNFDLELKDTITLENEQAEFVVQFSGTPLPKISWFKDGFEIFSSRRTRIITDNGKSVLLIHQTALNDEGEIKCTATNRAGHIATRAKLILEASPRIRLPRQYEDGLLFEQDETIRLKVSLAGRPSPVVTWYHDGELISKDERHVFEVMDGESILKIPDAKRKDRGEYTVKATNKLGEDAASFLVTVTDRPAAPGKVTVAMSLGKSVTLSWKEPEDDGGCKIGTYIIEYYRIGWEVWLKATTSRCTTATLTELIEGSEYKFRVKAENPYGVSDPSEESDVIFIPGPKRRVAAPLSEKSQSHREISRSRGEKREVSIATQRTRSLTREEARTRNDEDDNRFVYEERSASTQRLATAMLDRPSRADSRVTFAPDTLEKEEPPVPPVRSREHASAKQEVSYGNHTDRSNITADARNKQDVVRRERTMSPKPAIITISSPVEEDPRLHSLAMSRERRSLSPLSMPIIQEQREENRITASRDLVPSSNSILKRQTAVVNELMVSPPSSPQGMLREDDENALHGSSEFMLVLYPEDEIQEKDAIDAANGAETRIKRSTNNRPDIIELTEDEDDLIPPPISLSLPELFSVQHQVVEVMRHAVSSTELLHERAMERFYRAVAAEEAVENTKQKTQLERLTGELAQSDAESVQRSSSLRRRLSNSSVATQNLVASWQIKKTRRRLSEGQTDATEKTMKLLSPLLPDVEARSDPNLPLETTMVDPWRKDAKNESVKRLRRWHEANVTLLEEELMETNNEEEEIVFSILNKTEFQQPIQATTREAEMEEDYSIEISEESSEEISSADSEDLKLLKSRILARQIMDEEDTYHPRGRSVPHVEPEFPHISPDRVPSLEILPPPPVRAVTPVSPNNVMPKSILKKPKEETSQDNFAKLIPPEKPIRKILSQPYETEDAEETSIDIGEKISDLANMSETLKTPAMSESDTNSILSAAEAAKSRRMQSKLRSMTPEEEAAESEARMAVVNQYTEIVREYSSHSRHNSAPSSRRSSISEDQDQKHRVQEKLVPKLINKQEHDEASQLKIKNKDKTDKQKKNNQAPASKREGVNSRGTTPAKDTMIAKEKRGSRPSSRDQSPATRKKERTGGASSRSSSKTRNRTPSQERSNRPLAKNDTGEQDSRRSKVPSRPSSRSRSNSRERFGATSVESKVEKLQKALESNKYRATRKDSEVAKENAEKGSPDRVDGNQLALEAKQTVRSTVSYVTDLTLLMAAMYVYFFKRETLAVPFIVLLLYRRIQEEIRGWMPRRWWRSTKKR
ncbi:muscle M-line assembly protein unc-89 [Linepithema humile]|uniref:muscle M-line assembly protein unc-89 n=1 Tax=Linepithema humile TaxID=83485 RepID=UPI000623A5F5|nr:PREDICTED: uncharacterized protein LOC105670420 [Linepithema humile]